MPNLNLFEMTLNIPVTPRRSRIRHPSPVLVKVRQRHLVERSKVDLDALFCFFLESLECSMSFQRGSSLASMVVIALFCYFTLDVKLGPTFISFGCSFQSSMPTPKIGRAHV